jgi:hypothetical protein
MVTSLTSQTLNNLKIFLFTTINIFKCFEAFSLPYCCNHLFPRLLTLTKNHACKKKEKKSIDITPQNRFQ